MTHFTDPAGRTTEYRYADGLSQISERIEADGRVMRYHYDSERNLIGLSNAKGERYQLRYDRDENLVEEIGFDGRNQHYRYDAAGRLDAHAQRGDVNLGQSDWLLTQFQRDPLGRLLKKTGWDGLVSEYGYDALGRLHHASNPHSQLHLHYNVFGQVSEEKQGDSVIAHAYDALGRRSTTTTPGGQRIDYDYDERGYLQHIQLDGQILSRHRFNELGLESHRQQGELVSQYDYDPMGRLIQHQAKRQDKPSVLGRRYDYDPTGKLNAVDDFRLGSTRYVYDPAGNLMEERRGKGGHIISRYGYDSDNRLIRAETPNGTSHYRYDALGRRIAKQTPLGETRFIYDGATLLQETTGEQSRTYLFEPGSFRPLARIDQTATQTGQAASNSNQIYYHLDHLGTPREMTDATGRSSGPPATAPMATWPWPMFRKSTAR